ncbi:MAG: heme NO-binding domain-containing protein [Verrucomicrobiota bacterium]
MVNKAVEDMVCLHHGESVWEQIKARAGVEVDVFFGNEPYPDETTYQLVAAGSEMLKQTPEKMLEELGEHWVLHTAQENYGGLMRAAGKSLPEFLANLPNFHARVAMIFPMLLPPRFKTSEVTSHSLKLHYFTNRPKLTPFVVGLLQGLGKLFNTPVQVKSVESKDNGADHDVFQVQWELPASL